MRALRNSTRGEHGKRKKKDIILFIFLKEKTDDWRWFGSIENQDARTHSFCTDRLRCMRPSSSSAGLYVS